MAVFRENTDDFQRLDYQLLENSFVTLYYRPDILAEDLTWLNDNHYKIVIFDCSSWENTDSMHDDFAQKFDFPEYFGRNLDALDECFSDIDISETGGKVLVLNRFDEFAKSDSSTACIILDIIADKARKYLLFGKILLTLVQTNNPNLDVDLGYPSIGATQPVWNRREWLNSRRDIGEIYN